jgi:hypothetical protein
MKTCIKVFIISLSVLLRMKNFRTKFVEKIKKKNQFFFYIFAVYDIMCENIVEPGRPQDNMAHAHCMLNT